MSKAATNAAALLLAAAAQACAPSTVKVTAATAPQGAPPPVPKATAYATMQPVERYGIASTNEEVALARSAAPASISADADVLVLGKHGYETAVRGKNGFVCFVERSWANHFDSPEFWNPRVRAPNCYNGPAVRTVLPPYLQRTEWVLAGVPRQELIDRTKGALVRKEIVDPEPGSLSYMMSPQGHLSDEDGHWHPHVMFFVPRAAAASSGWGANLKGSPILALDGDDTYPVTIVFIPVRKWSDGSPGPAAK